MSKVLEMSSTRMALTGAMTKASRSKVSCVERIAAAVCVVVALVAVSCTTARAQHSDWLLGSFAFEGASQPPVGLYYTNLFSYYHTSSSDFPEIGALCGGRGGAACLSADFGGSGSFDLFVDAHIFTWTTPYKVLGANYGVNLIVPFAIADASGNASLEPVLSIGEIAAGLPPVETGGGSTKGSIGDIYVEPVNLGWHFKQLDLTASSGFFAPSGPYNADARLNIGFGHWTGVFGLGAVAYADAERTWSLSVYAHYLMYASQIGRDYTLGDVVPFEWAAGKTFALHNDVVKQATLGAVGYAQWQVTNNSIDVVPTVPPGTVVADQFVSSKSEIYAAGPGLTLLTKYGLYSLRWYEEFGAKGTPSGDQLMFSVTLPIPIPRI